MLTAAEVKAFLRVTDNSEDALISAQMAAADTYLRGKISKTKHRTGTDEAGAAVYTDLADDELYQQCVKLMVAHWFENRNIVATGTIVSGVQHTVDAIIAHIEICGDYE